MKQETKVSLFRGGGEIAILVCWNTTCIKKTNNSMSLNLQHRALGLHTWKFLSVFFCSMWLPASTLKYFWGHMHLAFLEAQHDNQSGADVACFTVTSLPLPGGLLRSSPWGYRMPAVTPVGRTSWGWWNSEVGAATGCPAPPAQTRHSDSLLVGVEHWTQLGESIELSPLPTIQ